MRDSQVVPEIHSVLVLRATDMTGFPELGCRGFVHEFVVAGRITELGEHLAACQALSAIAAVGESQDAASASVIVVIVAL